MKYEKIEAAVFKSRPNRFIAHVETERGMEVCHVKNTGRCRELLVPDARIWVQRNVNPARKTALDLIAVQKGDLLINMDSQPGGGGMDSQRSFCNLAVRWRAACIFQGDGHKAGDQIRGFPH